MVKVIIYYEKDRYKGFIVEGHTGYAEVGNDILCSGISAIVQTAVLSLMHYGGRSVEVKKESGFINCFVDWEELETNNIERMQVVFNTMLIGLENLHEEYNDYLSITKEVYRE